MPRKIIVLFILVTFLFTGCAVPSTESEETNRSVTLSECQLSVDEVRGHIDAECGTVSVPENPQDSNSTQITLNIAVIPAVSRDPAPDPVFFLAGGPGEAATESFLIVAEAFNAINRDRDIILVDQRGTGKSNPLFCSSAEEIIDLEDEDIQGYLQSCLANIDADPRFYHTSAAMKDLDLVRQGLGYDQINLYGVSYGTRAALVYLRLFPDQVRAVILDGVVPLGWNLGTDTSENAQRAIDLIFQRCQDDPGCGEAFPDLKSEFQELQDRLHQEPAEVTIPDPITAEEQTVTVDASYFASIVFNLSYSPETVALLPLLIHTTYEQNDFSLIAAQGLAVTSSLLSRMSDGMRYSVLCAEDIPFYQPPDTEEGYLGDIFGEGFIDICNNWPQGEIPAGFHDPVRSNAPVLIISGEADPVTPPENGDVAAETLPNSVHLVLPGQGHVNIFRGCVPRLASQFFENGSLDGLETECVEVVEPFPFFTSFAGPQP